MDLVRKQQMNIQAFSDLAALVQAYPEIKEHPDQVKQVVDCADGVIVEMHPCRDEALCDRRQALDPGQLRLITSEVHLVRTRRDG